MLTEQFATRSDVCEHLSKIAASDGEFRSKLVADPKSVVAKECGIQLSDDVEIRIHNETATEFHMVLPQNKLDAGDLDHIRGGWDGQFADW